MRPVECRHLSTVTSIPNSEMFVCESCGLTVPSSVIFLQIFLGQRRERFEPVGVIGGSVETYTSE